MPAAGTKPAPKFTGFSPAVFAWFRDLEETNTREFFAETRDFYERDIRDQVIALFGELIEEFPGVIHTFRPYRDIRFSADKSPIKTNCSGLIQNRPGTHAALYFEVSKNGLYAATGGYHWDKDQLARYRAAVQEARPGKQLEQIMQNLQEHRFEIMGERLASAPRGVPKDHPRLSLLQHKELYVGRSLAPEQCAEPSIAVAHVRDAWTGAADLNRWFDKHV